VRHETRTGYTLEIREIDRERIDAFQMHSPPPEPPVEEVEAFGGEIEKVERPNDPDYQAALGMWKLHMFIEELSLVADAVRIVAEPPGEREAVADLLGREPDTEALLRFSVFVDDADRQRVIEDILYLSTVTRRGIEEAAWRFGVKWSGKPVLEYDLGRSPAKFLQRYADWSAAVACNYTWEQFCRLSGPKQSEIVAWWMTNNALTFLQNHA